MSETTEPDNYPFISEAVSDAMEPCPFCGSIDLRFWNDNVHYPDADEPNWVVSCGYCTADGPPAATQADAINAWNDRS